MKKVVCLTLVVILIIALSSCSKEDFEMFFKTDEDLADDRMEQLFDAIKQQDKDAVKAMFSKKAISEADDIDIQADLLLSFVQGEALSWNRDESPCVSESVQYGYRTRQLIIWYTLYTDKQNYLILFVDYPIDTIDPENAGLYSMRILKAEDENKLVGTLDEDWIIPGIYIFDGFVTIKND